MTDTKPTSEEELRDLVMWIIDYEFQSPQARYSSRMELAEKYIAMIDNYITTHYTPKTEQQPIVPSTNKIKPPQSVIDYFEALGFKYEIITTSIYRDMRDAPIHFFQTDHKNHTADCSTLMSSDAIRIYEASR
jgi:hypothetical protein